MRRELYLRMLDEIGVGRLEAPVVERSLRSLGPGALLLRALAWARRRAWSRARQDTRAALEIEPVHELTKIIAAMIFQLCRDYDEALVLLETVASERKRVAHRALMLADDRATRLGWTHDARRIRAAIQALGVADLRAHVEGLRRRAGVEAGPSRKQPRARAAWLLERVHELGLEVVGEQLAALAEAAPEDRELLAARVRLELLAGQLPAAEARLAEAPEDGSELLELRAASSLARGAARAVTELEPPAQAGARWHALVGEAWLDLAGALDDDDEEAAAEARRRARGSIAAAREQAPEAAIPVLLAALVARDDGRVDLHDFDRAVRRLPALCSDAARELELELWDDDGVRRDPELARAVLERARAMLCADRDLRLPAYRTRSSAGVERLRPIPEAAVAESLHGRDDADLDVAGPMLRRVLRLPTTRVTGVHARPERVLSDAQREQFLRDGYVHLRGAFPRALAAELVDDAIRRIQSDPERWVEYYDAEPGRSLAGFDPEEPATWTWPRIDVHGSKRFAIPDFSPLAWAAIVELLGDPRRIRTRTWTDKFIANCCLEGDSTTPAPDWESWHLDDPSVHTRLDAIQCGLLAAVIYSDIEAHEGGTWLALDSPGRVARTLRERPEGVDFCDIDAGSAISVQCERFHEITGEAGDIVLIHPLMIHSAAPNPSGKIRWLANPMVYLEEPLDPHRDEPSLVEALIRDALS